MTDQPTEIDRQTGSKGSDSSNKDWKIICFQFQVLNFQGIFVYAYSLTSDENEGGKGGDVVEFCYAFAAVNINLVLHVLRIFFYLPGRPFWGQNSKNPQ